MSWFGEECLLYGWGAALWSGAGGRDWDINLLLLLIGLGAHTNNIYIKKIRYNSKCLFDRRLHLHFRSLNSSRDSCIFLIF